MKLPAVAADSFPMTSNPVDAEAPPSIELT
jgi:hypothetical protein